MGYQEAGRSRAPALMEWKGRYRRRTLMPIVQNLIAEEFGCHIGKYSGRLKVTQGGVTLAQAPLIHLESVTIAGSGVSISAEAVRACAERGIPIHFLSGTGTPYASL